jgi:membrane-bound serine protease (ClpP class)
MKDKERRSRAVRVPALLRVALLAACLAWGAGGAAAADEPGAVAVARFRGPVTPVLYNYVDRAIARAEATGASALVLQLDTPGGSVGITQSITQRIAEARVPLIVYVAPKGAHAGSAGAFIALAADLAVMAPGASIGAASPVGSEGADLPDTLKAKETNLLAADLKGLAARRGERAAQWAERAVTEAAAATAEEALALGVVDAMAADLPDLLRQLDGEVIGDGEDAVTLHTAGAPVTELPLTPLEGFLNAITSPALAAILLTIGLNAILFELSSPGGYAAGIIGTVCLLLALYALGTLDANWAGLGFIILAFVLFVVDIKAPTHGALTLGGILSFVGGAYLLFASDISPVPWPSIIGSAVASAAFFVFAMAKALQARRRRPATGVEALIGQTGEARQSLAPKGMVLVEGELWSAVSDSGPIPPGAPVVVTAMEGLTLRVRAI